MHQITAKLLPFISSLSLVYLIFYCYRPYSWPKLLVKTASTALLALIAFLHDMPLLGAALAAGSIGDAFIARDTEQTFMAGIGAFALSHILYVVLFLQQPASDISLLTHGFGLYAAGLVIALILGMAALLWPKAGDLRVPVLIYIPIIAAMGLSALTLDNHLIIVAAALFMLSDSVLAFETFVFSEKSTAKKITPFIVWGTYWPAQLMFLLAFMKII